MSTPAQQLVHQALAAIPLPHEWSWWIEMRPRRRTLGIEVDEGGSVLFAVPSDAAPETVADAVRSRLPRLAVEVSRRQRRVGGQAAKEMVSGTSFSYLGKRYRLRLTVPDPVRAVRLYRGRLEVPQSEGPEEAGRRIVDWYAMRGRRWLHARAVPLATRVGVTFDGLLVGDLGRSWGVCRPEGRIAVHWAAMQLPPELVDLVLVHELTHLRLPGHGGEFQRQMRFALTDLEERQRRFAAAERNVWRGVVC